MSKSSEAAGAALGMQRVSLWPAAMTFGNDPDKLDRYRAFWSRADATRPLTGFTLAGWFPLQEFAACRPWQAHRYLDPAMTREASS